MSRTYPRPSNSIRWIPHVEPLEARDQPATLTVDANQIVRSVNPQVLGTNLAWWDSNLGTATTKSMVQAAGLTLFRFPGGSSSDEFHFNAPPSYNGQGTIPSMAKFIASVNGGGMATLNYGTGDPKEAAAFLAYLNATTTNTTVIGAGVQWSNSANAWVAKDWKTASYWAALRAASPLSTDDGLNFLRLGRSAPFGFHYFEIGNEIYGSWETDHHGQAGDTGAPHDPATYIRFAKSFAGYAANIDPTISIGLAVGSVSYDNNWTSNILSQSASQGFTPGFLSDHNYMQAPGSENDAYLLHTVRNASQDGNSPSDWVARANGYRGLITQRLGAAGNNVELLATEFNSVYASPGKQATSLVNGLFTADSLGRLLESGYNGANVWDLRNSWETGNNNSSSLYGWRQGGDYGLLGSSGAAPATGPNTPYPTYFAEQLLSKIVHAGDTVVKTTSNSVDRTIYAVKQASGKLDLLVVNKDPTNNQTDQIQIAGIQPSGQAQIWQYGKTQDTAQSQTTDGHAALASSTASLTGNGASFSFTFPSYSMTVLELTPATTTVLTAANNPTTGGLLATFTATVAPSPGAQGAVTFRDNGVAIPGGSNIALVGGVATFQTAALSPGTHLITAAYSGAASFGASTSSALTFVVNAATPQVVSVTPNANLPSLAGPQRSRVASVVVVFDAPVQLDPDAFALALHTNNVSFDGSARPSGVGVLPASLSFTSADNLTWIVTFAGNTDDGADGLRSLQDGVYDLTIAAAKVHPLGLAGVNMAADRTSTFHRLFGDMGAPSTPSGGTPGADFVAIVNAADNLLFRGAFNSPTLSAGFDFDGNGIINSGDNLALRKRFNKPLAWRAEVI